MPPHRPPGSQYVLSSRIVQEPPRSAGGSIRLVFLLYIYEAEVHDDGILLSHCLPPASLVGCTRPVEALDGSTNGRVCQRQASPDGVFLETSRQRPISRGTVQPRFGRCRL